MEKQQKKVRNNYQSTEEQLRALDQASAEGWQLVKVGSFRIHYKKDPNVRYRYQMDYRNVDDLDRYLELFREQGWEQVCAVVSWRYFRKRWDPSLPEEAYEIFADPESRQQFRNRTSSAMLAAGVIGAVVAVLHGISLLKRPSIGNLSLFMAWTFLAACDLWVVWIVRHPDPARKKKPVGPLVLSILGMLASLGGMLWG